MKFIVAGSLKEVPEPHAPGNYHHPLPTLDCIAKCVKSCLPGVKDINLIDQPRDDKHEMMMIAANIEHEYQGQAINPFLNSLLDIFKRHLLSSIGNVEVLFLFKPSIQTVFTPKSA